jgi:hypothetical protein
MREKQGITGTRRVNEYNRNELGREHDRSGDTGKREIKRKGEMVRGGGLSLMSSKR